MELRLDYKKSVTEYFKQVALIPCGYNSPQFKLLSMMELLSDSLTEEQWKKLYKVVAYDY